MRTYSGLLLAIARRTFNSYGYQAAEQDAEDAVAEVWKNLLENDRRVMRTCLVRGNFLQTIHVLVRNRSVDIMRKQKNRTVELKERHVLLHSDERAGPKIDPELLRTAVENLPYRERILVKLFFLQEKKYREIAALTGIPQNSIGPTLTRAVSRLEKLLLSR